MDSLPNARLVVIEGRGHLAPIEQPEEVAAIRDAEGPAGRRAPRLVYARAPFTPRGRADLLP